MAFYLILSLFLVLVGHAFRLLRWEQFIRIYERPLRGQMLRGMAGGYALNFVLPFHLGDVFRAVFTGRRKNATEVLEYFHCADWFGVFITGEDVVRSKPDPEGYLKAMAHFGVTPAETMIFEDSGPGLEAARASGATVYKVEAF